MKIEDRLEIQDLVSLYAYYVDSFNIPAWVALFSPDGTLDESEFGMGKHEGRDGLVSYGEAIAGRTRHLVHLMSNHIIWEIQDDTARGTSFAIVESMRNTGERVRFHVKYEDQYRRLNGRWVIHERVLRKSFPHEVIPS